MIVNFTTRFGSLTMHGESAVALLRAAGHSGTVPGAILAADLPAALAQLERSLESEGDRPSPPVAATRAEPLDGVDDEEEREREPVVSLRMRAVPLLDMVRTAIARGSDLMWERG
jgi:hypothetical protein